MAKVVHMTTVDMSVRHLLLNQLLALRAAGFEVGAVSADGLDLDPVRAAGVPHWPVSFTRRMTPLQDLKAAWQIWRLCRRERFTIVHTHQVKAALFGQVMVLDKGKILEQGEFERLKSNGAGLSKLLTAG